MTDPARLAPFSELAADVRRRVLVSVAWRAFGAVAAGFLAAGAAETLLSLAYASLHTVLLASGAGAPALAASTAVYGALLLAILFAGVVLSFALFLRWAFRGEHGGRRLTLYALDAYPLAAGGVAQEPREVSPREIPPEIRSHLFWHWAGRVVIGVAFAAVLVAYNAGLALVALLAVPGFLAQWFVQASPPNAEFLLLDPAP